MINISFMFPAAAQSSLGQAVVSSQWLGEWTVLWKNTVGDKFVGNSRISQPLDDTLLKEELKVGDEGAWEGWEGTNLAKFNARNRTWHYACQDNRGGYCDFIGQFDNRTFSLQFVDAQGVRVKQRMIVRSINSKCISWDCERYESNTKQWRRAWKIEYRRN